jgi:hypothetical protein
MARNLGADDIRIVVPENATASSRTATPRDAQAFVAFAFAAGKRADSTIARRAVRPIDLERRARFSRFGSS